MKIQIALLALVLSGPSWATPTFCLRGFAGFAADESEPKFVVNSTYGALLDALGTEVSPETLEALIKKGAPFDVPDQAGTDLRALQLRMKDFEALVKKKEWDTPDVRAYLLEELGTRIQNQRQARASVDDSLERTGPTLLPLPKGGSVVQSPDGRYLIYRHFEATVEKGYVYDLQTKQKTAIGPSCRQASFSPDGTEIRFPRNNGMFAVFSFRDGKVGRDQSVVGVINMNWPTYATNRATAGEFVAGVAPARLFNSKSRKATVIRVDPFLGTLGHRDNGLRTLRGVKGTDDVYLHYNDKVAQTQHVVRAALASDGTLNSPVEWGRWSFEDSPEHIEWGNGGTPMFFALKSTKGTYAIPSPGAESKTLYLPDASRPGQIETLSLNVNPVTGELAALFSGARSLWVEVYDGTTFTKKGQFELRRAGGSPEIQFGVDGKTLIYTVGGRPPELIPYTERLVP